MQCNLCSISCAVGVNVVTLWSFHNYFSFCVVTFHQCENQTSKSSNKAHFRRLMNKSPAKFRAETLKQLASPQITFSSLMMMMMLQSEQHLRKWSFWEHVKDFHAKHVRSLPRCVYLNAGSAPGEAFKQYLKNVTRCMKAYLSHYTVFTYVTLHKHLFLRFFF